MLLAAIGEVGLHRGAEAVDVAVGVLDGEHVDGGRGHSYAEPTVRFEGDSSEGLRALSVALANGLPVKELKRSWGVLEKIVHGPWWELTSYPPKDLPQWEDRDTAARYKEESSTRDAITGGGRSGKLTSLSVQASAVFAQPVASGASTTFPRGDVAARRTRAVVVVDLTRRWLLRFVDGVECWC
jgi:hypothetical protein